MRVRYAPRARNDMVHIHQYVAAHNPKAAIAVVRRIRATANLLGRYPGLGRPTQIDDVRVIGAGRYPYLVYYRIHDDAVTIIHVRDARRDAPPSSSLR